MSHNKHLKKSLEIEVQFINGVNPVNPVFIAKSVNPVFIAFVHWEAYEWKSYLSPF